MDGLKTIRRIARHGPTAAVLMVLAAPAGTLAGEGATHAPAAPFETAFAPLPAPITAVPTPPGAVDLDTFVPPVEEEPSATPLGSGHASYYGRRFHGRSTASGERFDMHALTAAHRTLPFGSLVRVTNPHNGRSVTVRINDRGPFVRGRTIDLSRAAATQIGIVARGHGQVELELLD